jgi:hypothetical protein
VRLKCDVTILSFIWLLARLCEETSVEFFLEFFCRETENICMHVSLNTIDLQVPLQNDVLKILLKRRWDLNMYIWINLRLMISAVVAMISSLDMWLKSCASCCNLLSIFTGST